MEEKICEFKKYASQTLDLLVDAYKWQVMAEECDNPEMSSKYMSIRNTLYELFMTEHNAIGAKFNK